MELDFETIKALSSPTRIKILHHVLDHESTPTSLSEDVGRSKSTIVSHLETLENADLVDKNVREGRRRVIYSPTRKAQAIVEGRERKVRFAITSAVMSLGVTVGAGWYRGKVLAQQTAEAAGDAGAMTMMEAEGAGSATDAAGTAAEQGLVDPATALLMVGVGSFTLAAALFFYGAAINKLAGDDENNEDNEDDESERQ